MEPVFCRYVANIMHERSENGKRKTQAYGQQNKFKKPLYKYCLTVYNLSSDVSEIELAQHFSATSDVINVKIPTDKITKEHLGYAFVNVSDEASCMIATSLTDTYLNGRRIGVIPKVYHERELTGEDIKNFELQEQEEANKYNQNGNVMSVRVVNLDYSAKPQQIRKHFERFCQVASVVLPRDPQNKPKGYCYVNFEDQASFLRAFRFHESYINGRLIAVIPNHNRKGKKEDEPSLKRSKYNNSENGYSDLTAL